MEFADHRVAADGRVCVRCYRDLGPKMLGLAPLPGYQPAGWECLPPTRIPKNRRKGRTPRKKWTPAAKQELVASIYLRDGRLCHYCGREMMPIDEVERLAADGGRLPVTYPTIDHVVPLSKGGTNGQHNLVVACYLCNVRKGDSLDVAPAAFVRPKRVVDASECDLCHGHGNGWHEDRDKPCPDCRGVGKMSIDRYAELLHDRSVELAKLRKKYAGEQRAVIELRSILEQAASGGRVWRERVKMVQTIQSQRRTIERMGSQLKELGSGRTELHVVDEETA